MDIKLTVYGFSKTEFIDCLKGKPGGEKINFTYVLLKNEYDKENIENALVEIKNLFDKGYINQYTTPKISFRNKNHEMSFTLTKSKDIENEENIGFITRIKYFLRGMLSRFYW